VQRGRREFLRDGSRAALALSLVPLTARFERKDTAALRDLEEQIPKLMKDAVLPGLSIALVKHGALFWRRSFGVRNSTTKAPVDNATVFEAGSMSKPVFAYAALKLCERGIIGLDTPLTKYAPRRVLEGDPRLDLVTARHVLSHSSGFQNWRSKKDPLKIHFQPGEKYLYSGEGYSYLQSVVTHLTGRSDPKSCSKFEDGVDVCASDIDAYMRKNVFVPFGMTSSGYVWNERFERHTSWPHDAAGKPLPKGKSTATDAARYAAAGGLHATPTDYAKFLIEVLNPKPADAFRLRKHTLAEMVRPHVKVDDQRSWALGWEVAPTEWGDWISHGGDNTGFHSFAVASLKSRSGYVVMTNGEGGTQVLLKLIFGDTTLNQLIER